MASFSSYLRDLSGQVGLELRDLRSFVGLSWGLSLSDQLKAELADFTEDSLAELVGQVKRIASGERPERILNRACFYGREFGLNRACLIPRPDSELLVDQAIQGLCAQSELRLLDICAGSGCLGLTTYLELVQKRIELGLDKSFAGDRLVFLDLSKEALSQAGKNCQSFALELEPDFIAADFLQLGKNQLFDLLALPGQSKSDCLFDIILFNPPYLSEEEYAQSSPDFKQGDPVLALVARNQGLEFYQVAAGYLPSLIRDGGSLLIEHGYGQADQVRSLFEPWSKRGYKLRAYRDLAGLPRMLKISL